MPEQIYCARTDRFGPNQVQTMMEYQTHDGTDVPTDVAEAFDATPWNETHDYVEPTNVATQTAVYGELWIGQVDGREQYVSEYGRATPHDRFDYLSQARNGQIAEPFVGETMYYGDDDVTVVHHDHYMEHVTKVIVVTGPNERVVLGSRSGVVWTEPQYDGLQPVDLSADSPALELATALLDAPTGVDVPEQFTKAVGGWHSSVERSEQSELVNALSQADVPAEWQNDDSMFPFAVRFGDTNNVCSVNASAYGTEQFDKTISRIVRRQASETRTRRIQVTAAVLDPTVICARTDRFGPNPGVSDR